MVLSGIKIFVLSGMVWVYHNMIDSIKLPANNIPTYSLELSEACPLRQL